MTPLHLADAFVLVTSRCSRGLCLMFALACVLWPYELRLAGCVVRTHNLNGDKGALHGLSRPGRAGVRALPRAAACASAYTRPPTSHACGARAAGELLGGAGTRMGNSCPWSWGGEAGEAGGDTRGRSRHAAGLMAPAHARARRVALVECGSRQRRRTAGRVWPRCPAQALRRLQKARRATACPAAPQCYR